MAWLCPSSTLVEHLTHIQGRAGQGRAGQGRAGQGRAGQGRAGQGRAGQAKNGQTDYRFIGNWTERLTYNKADKETH